MHRKFLGLAAVLAALAVILGAFGAHSLKNYLGTESISVFETGVRYQFYHSFALFITAFAAEKFPGKWISYAGNCFIAGIVLFSGSLYVLTLLKAADAVGLKGVGILTPIGGLFFIAGWISLLMVFRHKTTSR
ncbi:MAG: DUF423 domain-containing protein [Flavitalea sp.]